MRKTVTMRKGDRFADIFDSPETIAQAQKDGYHLCTDDEQEARDALRKEDAKKQIPGNDKSGINAVTENKPQAGLLAMSKKELLELSKNKGIFDESFSKLFKDDLIKGILETVKAKVVEAKLKTAEEAAALTEADLFALFDTIGK